jgi:4-hydroxy-tetrahydrodipicolinate reductase
LTVEEFKARVAAGSFGHVGLPESLSMIAEAVGWKLDDVRQSIEPVTAETPCQTQYTRVESNQVAGLHQVIEGSRAGEPVITLDFKAYVCAQDPKDRIIIEGVPPVDMTIQGGIHGDYATAAIAVNAVPKVIAHVPGLVTMKDIPVLSVLPAC